MQQPLTNLQQMAAPLPQRSDVFASELETSDSIGGRVIRLALQALHGTGGLAVPLNRARVCTANVLRIVAEHGGLLQICRRASQLSAA